MRRGSSPVVIASKAGLVDHQRIELGDLVFVGIELCKRGRDLGA
jgi:hypothetical protein